MQVEIWEFVGYDGDARRGDLAAVAAAWERLGGTPEALAATHQGAQTFPARSGQPVTVRGAREHYGRQVEVSMTYRYLFAAQIDMPAPCSREHVSDGHLSEGYVSFSDD